MLSKVITIAQQKGGTGKTTLAVHLALAFIKYHNLKIAIIDTDPQGSLGQWFMIREEKKLSNDNLTFKTASLWGAQYESKTLKKDHDIVIIDTPVRLLPGVLGNVDSLHEETFEKDLLEYPQYTKPQKWEGKEVPSVLLSGDHAKIKHWRLVQSEDITRRRRPDLWKKYKKNK